MQRGAFKERSGDNEGAESSLYRRLEASKEGLRDGEMRRGLSGSSLQEGEVGI